MENRSNGMLVIGVLVAVGAIGLAFLSTNYSGTQEAEKRAPITASNSATSNTAALDSDGDGAPDWKEVLWRLDPQNPDTNGDGITDGEEIASKENASYTSTSVSNTTYIAPAALTPTEAISREIFAGYANFKQDGSFTSTDAELAVSETLTRNITSKEAAPSYTVSNIVITTSASMSEYEAALTRAFKKMTDVREYELTTFTRVVETENFSELTKLVAAGAIYNEVVGLLLIVETPDILAAKHLAVINALSGLAYATDRLSTWNGDPLVGLDLVNAFVSAEQDFSSAVSGLYTIINTVK